MELKGIRRILDIYETKTMERNKIDNWGVFVENEQLETYEIKLPENLAQKVWDFIKNSDKKDIIGEKGKLLKENLNVDLIFHEDRAIGIELPNQVQFKIKSTDVALKGQTVSSSYKPAVLENDIKIQVPPFIESGDEILVDTRTIEYIKKL